MTAMKTKKELDKVLLEMKKDLIDICNYHHNHKSNREVRLIFDRALCDIENHEDYFSNYHNLDTQLTSYYHTYKKVVNFIEEENNSITAYILGASFSIPAYDNLMIHFDAFCDLASEARPA